MSRFPVKRDETRLKVVHRQRVQRQGDADPAPPFRAERYGAEVIGQAALGWQKLLETEYESVVIAGWMTAALARMGAPLDIVGAFGRVVEDEIRHVDLCAQVVELLGGTPTVPVAAQPPFPTGDLAAAGQAEFEAISGLVTFFCVFEQLSGLVFRQAIEQAQEPVAKWALSEIFRDEAFHGAFGFEAARIYVPRWTDEQREALAGRVVQDIRRFESRIGGPLPAGSVLPVTAEVRALETLGLLSPQALLRTFYEGVQKQLVPRMKDIGLELDLRVVSA